MKKMISKTISVILSLAIVFSLISVNSMRTDGEENTILESMETDSELLETITKAETAEESATEQNNTGILETNSPETTIEETDTGNDIKKQNQVIELIKNLPEKTQEDYMEKVKQLYNSYSDLTDEEKQGLSTEIINEYEDVLTQAGEINHKDDVTGIWVDGENLPWYVKVVAEKTDESLFQEKYNSYFESLYEEDNELDEESFSDDVMDETDNDEEWDDTEDVLDENQDEDNQSEEALNDEENWSDEEFTNDIYYSNNRLGYRYDDEKLGTMASSYKISLYNTMEEKDYSIPEGMKVKVYLPYLKTYLGYNLEIVHLKDDETFELLYPQLFDKITGNVVSYDSYYNYPYEIMDNDAEGEDNRADDWSDEDNDNDWDDEDNDDDWDEDDSDDDWDEDADEGEDIEEEDEDDEGWSEEEYKKWVDEENSKINVDDYNVVFETDSFSEFAVLLVESKMKAESAMDSSVVKKNKNNKNDENISPKTGYDLWVPAAMALGSGMIVLVSLILYRKRNQDIV